MHPILVCNNLTKKFNNKSVLKEINISLNQGKIIGLLGPNGSGKTTLIKLISGLLSPTSGTVLVNGISPNEVTKSYVSYLPDRNTTSDSMTVKGLLRFYDDFYEDFDRYRAVHMLHDLDIDLKSRIKVLSKGTKEKVQLIMVMSRKAKLYLLDEPIGGVDPATRDYILNTIITNYEPDALVIISTHLIADVEKILDEVIFIKEGEVYLQSSVDDIREEKHCSVNELFREVFKCS